MTCRAGRFDSVGQAARNLGPERARDVGRIKRGILHNRRAWEPRPHNAIEKRRLDTL
jgi:hypothetical protein